MKSILVGVLLGGVAASISSAAILPASRGGTGANITPTSGFFVYSTNSGFAVGAPNSVTVGTTLAVGTGFTLATGTATAYPILIPNGVTLSTPKGGVIESNGTNLYWTDKGGNRYKFNLTIQ